LRGTPESRTVDSVCGAIIVLERSGYALSPTWRACIELTTRVHIVYSFRAIVYSEELRAILLISRIRQVNIDRRVPIRGPASLRAPRLRPPSAPAAREPAAQRAPFRAAPAGRLPIVPRRHGRRRQTVVGKRKNGQAERRQLNSPRLRTIRIEFAAATRRPFPRNPIVDAARGRRDGGLLELKSPPRE
jgi:hypothetical protein